MAAARKADPPHGLPLRVSFLVLWFVDLITAGLFFVVPHVSEANPVTVYLYALFGIPGIALAAGCYAAVVLLLGYALSAPADRYFLALVVATYVLLVANNLILLVLNRSLVRILFGV